MENDETIVAIATAPGKAGIGIVRVSGKNLKTLTKGILGFTPKARYVHYGKFFDEDAQIIDQGIALYFVAPYSYTGEDILELHGHGSPILLNLLLSRCVELGARLARPGEFTLRALLNEKIDLIQAESVADIINATTSQAARCAVKSLQGKFSIKIHELTASLAQLRVFIEASLDFPEEETIELATTQITNQLSCIRMTLQQIFNSSKQGKLLQEGIQAVLVGEPNVGKSCLMNQLVEEDVSIVTEIPGTTRDAIHHPIQIEGVPLHIIDTAGVREASDVVEKSGIARTYAAIQKADILLHVKDISQERSEKELQKLDNITASLPKLNIFNKIDLQNKEPAMYEGSDGPVIWLSAKTGAGLPLLRQAMLKLIGWGSKTTEENVYLTRQRHLDALFEAQEHLQNAVELVDDTPQLDLLAEELRLAQQALASITGEFTSDDLLGEIFSSFCIGK